MKNFVKCEGCGKLFPAKVGKKFHTVDCAQKYYRREKDAQSAALWTTLPTFEFPEEAAPEVAKLDDAGRVRAAITTRAPAGAVFYRLGCPKPDVTVDEELLRLRWFPSRTQRSPPLFPLDPYDDPAVPYPGLYAVAYFDRAGQIIGEPVFKVEIPFWQRLHRWHHGDLSYVLRTPIYEEDRK